MTKKEELFCGMIDMLPRLDERTESILRELQSQNDHLEKLNGSVTRNMLEIASQDKRVAVLESKTTPSKKTVAGLTSFVAGIVAGIVYGLCQWFGKV